MDTERQSNIELLRIVLILMVLVLHFNYQAYNVISSDSPIYWIINFFEAFSISAVNCFMMISGFFLSYNRKIKCGKIVDLMLTIVFFDVVAYLIKIIYVGEQFSIKVFMLELIPLNYFALYYICIYIISPFITILFDSLERKQQSCFVLILVCLFVLYNTFIDLANDLFDTTYFSGYSTISRSGSSCGYTIVQFFVAFVIGVYLRRSAINISRGSLLFIYFISSIIIGFGSYKISSFLNYSCIFNVINAACLLLIFTKISIHSRLINIISKSVFPIYCIHILWIPSDMIWKNFFFSENQVNRVTSANSSIWIISGTLVMFLFCLAYDMFCRLLFNPIKKKICSLCPVIIIDNRKADIE